VIHAKLSIEGAGSAVDLSQFTGNSNGTVGDVQFFANDDCEEADVWLVVEGTETWDRTCTIPPGRLVYVGAEAARGTGFIAEAYGEREYLEQFDLVYTFLDDSGLDIRYAPPVLPWMINSNHGPTVFAKHLRDVNFFRDLDSVAKRDEISVFCSTKTFTPEHRMRLRFVERLKEHFGDRLSWFGNGENPVGEKWEGLAPYRYSLVLENQASNMIFTEKIMDAYLAMAFPIYWGAPNLDSFFPKDSFRAIDIKHFDSALEVIEGVLEEDPYDSALPSLLRAKRLVTDDYNFVNRLASIAQESIQVDHVNDHPKKVRVDVRPRRRRPLDSVLSLAYRLKRR